MYGKELKYRKSSGPKSIFKRNELTISVDFLFKSFLLERC